MNKTDCRTITDFTIEEALSRNKKEIETAVMDYAGVVEHTLANPITVVDWMRGDKCIQPRKIKDYTITVEIERLEDTLVYYWVVEPLRQEDNFFGAFKFPAVEEVVNFLNLHCVEYYLVEEKKAVANLATKLARNLQQKARMYRETSFGVESESVLINIEYNWELVGSISIEGSSQILKGASSLYLALLNLTSDELAELQRSKIAEV